MAFGDHNWGEFNLNFATELISGMRSHRVPNYIAPGLVSSLVGREDCKVRMFEMTKHQDFFISPHNHRFDFACYVLCGTATNYIFGEHRLPSGDHYQVSEYIPDGTFGKFGYRTRIHRTGRFIRTSHVYQKGEWYGMKKNEFHSIEFSKGAKVLFFEGKQQDSTSCFLEPIVNGKVIPTFKVEDWMYHE